VAGWAGVGAVDAGHARPGRGPLAGPAAAPGRPDLVQFAQGGWLPSLAAVSAATVGAVLASRRPRHPVGRLLLVLAVSLGVAGAAGEYDYYGLLARPGALPAASSVALYVPATVVVALITLGFVLLLTPTGLLPSPRWRWWSRVTAATPVSLLLVVALAPKASDTPHLATENPLDLRGLGGAVLVANQVAFAVAILAVVVAAGSLVVRFRRARGIERQQLRWVALAAALIALAALVILAALALGSPILLDWAAAVCVAVLPVAVGAAILRYRLYDLDRIISRTLAYGLLTLLLGGGYAAVARTSVRHPAAAQAPRCSHSSLTAGHHAPSAPPAFRRAWWPASRGGTSHAGRSHVRR